MIASQIKCRTCGADGDVRASQQEGAYGKCFLAFCERCYAADVAERKAEAKRFGYRVVCKAWAKLVPVAQAPWIDA